MKRTLVIMAITVAGLWPGAAAAQDPTTTTTAPAVVGPDAGAYVAPTTLVRAPVQVQGAQLTRTGQDSDQMVYIGAGLAAAGAVLVVGARHRRRAATVPA